MSRHPASTIGWLATTPTVWPFDADEAGDDVACELLLNLEEIASSATLRISSFMS